MLYKKHGGNTTIKYIKYCVFIFCILILMGVSFANDTNDTTTDTNIDANSATTYCENDETSDLKEIFEEQPIPIKHNIKHTTSITPTQNTKIKHIYADGFLSSRNFKLKEDNNPVIQKVLYAKYILKSSSNKIVIILD